jgi:hypothetical protein
MKNDFMKGISAMKLLEKLTKKPLVMQRTIGMNLDQFNALAKALLPLWKAAEKQRKASKKRKRKMGGGRPYKLLSIQEKLVVVLLYYKAYLTQEFIGAIVGLDQVNVSRLLAKMLPLIEQVADPNLKSYLAKARAEYNKIPLKERVNNWADFVKKHPDLKDVSTDATEQHCHRSQDDEKQKKYYSGKSKRHTLKTQVSVSSIGRILDVSDTYPGSIHDKTIIDQEQTVQKIPEQTLQRFDAGYQGVAAENPQHLIITPYKKPKKQELSAFHKQLNTVHSRHRVVAENGICRVKKFKICQYRYRGREKSYNQTFRNVVALVNFKLDHSAASIA